MDMRDEAPGINPVPPALPAVDDVERVEAEKMDGDPEYRYGRRAPHFEGEAVFSSSSAGFAVMKPPVLVTWICLCLAWLFLGSRIPFTVFLGLPFALASVFLAMICLSRGGVITGILVTVLGTVGSFIVYLVGVFRFLARL